MFKNMDLAAKPTKQPGSILDLHLIAYIVKETNYLLCAFFSVHLTMSVTV